MADAFRFQGMVGSKDKGYHSIRTEDPYFRSIGLSVFTSGQLWEALGNNYTLTLDPQGSVSGVGHRQGVYDKIMDQPGWFHHTDELSTLTAYSAISSYPAIGGGDRQIEKLIEVNNQWVNGDFTKTSDMEKFTVLSHVKTSQGGFVEWSGGMSAPLYINFQPAMPSGQRCVKEFNPKFKVYLFDGANQRMDSRPVVWNGPPTFTAMPVTNFGKPYSWADTDASDLPPGQYAEVNEGGEDNPKNKVAGQLDVSYNKNTGKFEAGTPQLLARLLMDVPAVRINGIPSEEHGIHLMSKEEAFNLGSAYYTGYFCAGHAVPFSVHHGNPYKFGPNWKTSCKGGNDEKEVILCINRSRLSYKSNDMVMLSKIDGEWIMLPMGQDDDGDPGPGIFGVQGWSFMNLIADADCYFKDHRYWKDAVNNGYGANGLGGEPWALGFPGQRSTYNATVSSTQHEEDYRILYYSTMRTTANAYFMDVALRNLNSSGILPANFQLPDFESSTYGYWQTSAFDMLSTAMGGTKGESNNIGPANIVMNASNQGHDVDDNGTFQNYIMYPFWGVNFPDGYRAGHMADLKDKSDSLTIYPQGASALWNFGPQFTGSPGDGAVYYNPARDVHPYGGIFTYFDGASARLQHKKMIAYQMPADVALNASPKGKFGSPMEDMMRIKQFASIGSNVPVFDNANKFFSRTDSLGNAVYGSGAQTRYSWLAQSGSNIVGEHKYGSLYDFRPVNDGKVTFTPMTIDYVGSTDLHSSLPQTHPMLFDPMLYSHGQYWTAGRQNEADHDGQGVVPQVFFHRNRKKMMGTPPYGPTAGSYGASYSLTGHLRGKMPGGLGEANVIPYDFWVRNFARNKWSPNCKRYFSGGSQDGAAADVVSIVAAKCKVRAKASFLVFHTKQFLGCAQFATSIPGSPTTISIIGALFGWSSPGGPPRATKTPQWGNHIDNVESFGTTALHGRVFDQWPDEQTIYDPRYMSVLHFNPGQCSEYVKMGTNNIYAFQIPSGNKGFYYPGDTSVGLSTFRMPLTLSQATPADRTYDTTYNNGATQEALNDWTLGSDYPKYVDVADYGCDHRIPTWGATQINPNGGFDLGVDKMPVANGTIIFKYNHNVAGGGTGGTGGGIATLRDPEHWNIDPVRRGKLLTGGGGGDDKLNGFWYKKTTIGLAGLAYVEFGSGDASQLAGPCMAGGSAPGGYCVGVDGGKLFSVGDIIGVAGGHGEGAEFVVIDTENNRRTYEPRAIMFNTSNNSPDTGLKYRIDPDTGLEMRGQGYWPEDFAEVNANGKIKPGSNSKVRLVPKVTETNGKFNINPMVMAGQVREVWVLDRAPSQRGAGLSQLSRGSNNGAGDQRSQSSLIGGTTGRTIGTREISFDVADVADQKAIYSQGNARYTDTTSNLREGSFDCFLYFHSDAGHQSADGCGNFNNQQNYITLEITTR